MIARVRKDKVEDGESLPKKTAESPPIAQGPEAEHPGVTGELEDLMVRLQEAEKKAAENYDKYVRAAAELDNYRKRAVREKSDAIQYGNETLLRDILPLVDGMDRALEQACNSNDFAAFKKGLEMLKGQLLGCLQKHGVESIDTAGKEFDPHVHEAMMQVMSAEHEDSKVVDEFERGYLLKGRLLRPAKVSVCKRSSMGDDRKNHCEEA
jgi:molecular chaperone GrpE